MMFHDIFLLSKFELKIRFDFHRPNLPEGDRHGVHRALALQAAGAQRLELQKRAASRVERLRGFFCFFKIQKR